MGHAMIAARLPRAAVANSSGHDVQGSTTPDLVRLARQGYENMSRDLEGVMSLFAADAVYDMSTAG